MAKEEKVIEEEVGKREEPKPRVKVAPKKEGVRMLISQYFKKHKLDIHPYTRAYHEATYYGIMKTKDEWDSMLKDKL